MTERDPKTGLHREQQVLGGAIVHHQGKVLLLKRSAREKTLPHLWEFPSGKKELGERLADTVRRECFEESGLRVRVLQLVGYLEYGIERPQEIRDCTQLNFLCEIEPGTTDQVRLSEAHETYRWVGLDELSMVDDPQRRDLLDRVLRGGA